MEPVLVTLKDDVTNVSRISQDLEQSGLSVRDVFPNLGVIRGDADTAVHRAVRAHPGVLDVERDYTGD